MPEFDFTAGYRRYAAAMGSGSSEAPVIAQMHEFAMRESGTYAGTRVLHGRPKVRARHLPGQP